MNPRLVMREPEQESTILLRVSVRLWAWTCCFEAQATVAGAVSVLLSSAQVHCFALGTLETATWVGVLGMLTVPATAAFFWAALEELGQEGKEMWAHYRLMPAPWWIPKRKRCDTSKFTT